MTIEPAGSGVLNALLEKNTNAPVTMQLSSELEEPVLMKGSQTAGDVSN
jgi:hypothetical protein